MELKQLTIEPRSTAGKGAGRRLRREGKIPAIIYGADNEPKSAAVNAHDVEYVLSHDIRDNPMVTAKWKQGDGEIRALIKDVQRHPVTGQILHADLMRLTLDKQMTFSVRVELVGTPVGVRQGGSLEHLLNSITVRCLPDQAPALVAADITALRVGQKLTVADLTIPEGLEVVEHMDDAVAVVKATREALPEEAAAEGAAAEGAEGEGEKEEAGKE
ncbi:50S ribosomal protein L25 [Candidatus Sumerlaeota bacterium]|nr:50S ribosomal protein L25 [Candidatus Sumerlaeota bacterium]